MARKAILRVKDAESEWDETYVEGEEGSFLPDHDVPAWAQRLIDWFNRGLRPLERPRELVSVRIEQIAAADTKEAHQWKKTNLVTLMGVGGSSPHCNGARALLKKRFDKALRSQ